jgi:hypothetical protein
VEGKLMLEIVRKKRMWKLIEVMLKEKGKRQLMVGMVEIKWKMGWKKGRKMSWLGREDKGVRVK